MKTIVVLIASLLLVSSCATQDPYDEWYNTYVSPHCGQPGHPPCSTREHPGRLYTDPDRYIGPLTAEDEIMLTPNSAFLFGGDFKGPVYMNDRMIWGATKEPIYIFK